MILQALTDYYEQLAQRGLVARPGWGPAKVSYGLDLREDGSIAQVFTLLQVPADGKKGKPLPRIFSVPLPVKRTSGVQPNFLCDTSGYLLGADQKGKAERTRECFQASGALHKRILESVNTLPAQAILRYFETWEPTRGPELPETKALWETLTGGCNLLFYVDGKPAMEDVGIREAWQRAYDSTDEGVRMRCLVTGEDTVIPPIHSAIKGIPGAQTSGAALVSFNAKAFESYDREQNFNAPIGAYAAFAYTTALNYLIADWQNRTVIGETMVLCWAKSADPAYQEAAMMAMMGGDEDLEADVRAAVAHLAKGERIDWDESSLDPEMPFYVLGISPNAARLSVRFFLRNSFGQFMANLNAHYERLRICRPAYEKKETIPLWMLLQETVNQNARTKNASPQLAGEMLRSILSGAPYPATLIQAVELRIRAEHDVPYRKAAIIKAYYSRNKDKSCPEEVLQVALNEDAKSVPYQLGRLFSVLEKIQEEANPGINSTIKDKFFNAAAATPAIIFANLLNLSEKHMRKLDGGKKVILNKLKLSIIDKLPEQLPARLTLPEQGSFQLGYYHQTQKRYEKKAD